MGDLDGGRRIFSPSRMVRLRAADTAVEPTLSQHARLGAAAFTRMPVVLGCWGVVPWVLAHSVLFESYERPEGWRLVGMAIFLMLAISAWAGGWAFITRVVSHEWRFLAHTAVACAFIAIDLVGDAIQGYTLPGRD